MNYRNFDSLARQSHNLASLLPSDVEVVVGIPRSGLLAANLVALYRNLPLTDLHSFQAGRLLSSGERLRGVDFDTFLSSPRKVVVIDDSLHGGTQMNFVKQQIHSLLSFHSVVFAVVYIDPGKEDIVNYYSEVVASPRFFEWNIMHSSLLRQACVDIDGVLCRDPSSEENDDGERYEVFLSSVQPKNIPSHEIGWLVTCRLEKYRENTENWLKKHGVKYRVLIMMDLPDKASRIRNGSHSIFKAHRYADTGAKLFIESSKYQAIKISKLTHKPVFCFENWELVKDESIIYKIRLLLYKIQKKILKQIKKLFEIFESEK